MKAVRYHPIVLYRRPSRLRERSYRPPTGRLVQPVTRTRRVKRCRRPPLCIYTPPTSFCYGSRDIRRHSFVVGRPLKWRKREGAVHRLQRWNSRISANSTENIWKSFFIILFFLIFFFPIAINLQNEIDISTKLKNSISDKLTVKIFLLSFRRFCFYSFNINLYAWSHCQEYFINEPLWHTKSYVPKKYTLGFSMFNVCSGPQSISKRLILNRQSSTGGTFSNVLPCV